VFFQAGYSNSFKYGTYSLTAGRTANSDGTMSNEIMLSTTIPLGHSQHAPQLTTNVNLADHSSSVQNSISGTAGANNQYSYNAYGTASKNTGSDVNLNAGASGTYRAPYAQFNASVSGGQNSSQVSVGASGSVVAHPGGLSLSQTVGDTFGVVEAKGAEGASLSSVSGAKVDSHGYAVVPYLTPYSMNTVDIDPKGSSTDVEFDSTSNQSAPHAGSIVMLKYKTQTGRAALIHAPRMDGEALPFGAEVTDWDGHVVGVVAQDSRIFARGVADSGKLIVKWGDQPGDTCNVSYNLPQKDAQPSQAAYTSVETHCMNVANAMVADAANEPSKAAVASN
jgi:outer membrane usher protein